MYIKNSLSLNGNFNFAKAKAANDDTALLIYLYGHRDIDSPFVGTDKG